MTGGVRNDRGMLAMTFRGDAVFGEGAIGGGGGGGGDLGRSSRFDSWSLNGWGVKPPMRHTPTGTAYFHGNAGRGRRMVNDLARTRNPKDILIKPAEPLRPASSAILGFFCHSL